MTDDDIEPARALQRDHLHDPELVGLERLLRAAAPAGIRWSAVARAWAKVRAERNRQALARMRKGDSNAGLLGVYPRYRSPSSFRGHRL